MSIAKRLRKVPDGLFCALNLKVTLTVTVLSRVLHKRLLF